MKEKPIMLCGHIALGTIDDGKPVCPICMCYEVQELKPNLTSRIARCVYCGFEKSSNFELPFFEYRQDKEKDTWYCGCRGFD